MDKKQKLAPVPKILAVGPDVLQHIFAYSTFAAHDFTTQALVCKEFQSNVNKAAEYLCQRMQFNLDRIKTGDYAHRLYTNVISSRLIALGDFASTRAVTLVNHGHNNMIWRHVTLPPLIQKLVLEGLDLTRSIINLPPSITELVLVSCRLSLYSFARLSLPSLHIVRLDGYTPTSEDLQTCDGLVKRCPTVEQVWVSGSRVRVDDVMGKLCREPTCRHRPSHGLRGTSQRICCVLHADPTMENLRVIKRCRMLGCQTRPSYALIGGNCPTFCAAHADLATMENVRLLTQI